MKRFSQFILGVVLLFASTTAFAGGVYASFRNTGSQALTNGNHLSFNQTDINEGGGITKQAIGGGDPGDEFIINIDGDYLINSSCNNIFTTAPTYLTQLAFDLLVNGVERDRITTNYGSSVILRLKAGDVVRFQYQGLFAVTLSWQSNVTVTETNTSAVTFHKLDGNPSGVSTCPGGLH